MLDVTSYVIEEDDNHYSVQAAVTGMHCISCVRNIENALNDNEDVISARVNLSANRLEVKWTGQKSRGSELVDQVNKLGYKARPYVPGATETADEHESKFLLKTMAVAGFAMGNIMLLSIAVWSSTDGEMGDATRQMIHLIAAIIALPAVCYSGQPFFRSAFLALKNKTTNMDVPISVGVLLTTGISLYETFVNNSRDVYFDSAVMFLFFLLIGRYLNIKARGKARSAAHGLLEMMSGTANILQDKKQKTVAIKDLKPGMVLQVASGEKIAADGCVLEGSSELDTSLLTGETLPQPIAKGGRVFAGTLNLNAPLAVQIEKPSSGSLISDIVRLMEKAEQGDAKFVRLSDRVAKLYTPVVHVLGLLTFLYWYFIGDIGGNQATLYAVAVLIITCPCALGLAVPVVQVLASSRLFKKGILLKSGDALEKLSNIDTVVFDKTGTLTLGKMRVTNSGVLSATEWQLASSLAARSNHPLSRAIAQTFNGELVELEVEEIPGCGIKAQSAQGEIRLGKKDWVAPDMKSEEGEKVELWFSVQGKPAKCLIFDDHLRDDIKEVVADLHQKNMATYILSGDRQVVVERVAKEIGIVNFEASVLPDQKCQKIEALKKEGKNILMVGDGLNDAPALALAHVSMSPASAMDITQTAADVVFQGDYLEPILIAHETAKVTDHLTRINLWLAFIYNIIAIPMAFMGYVTPMVAAISMSASSIIVVMNSLRLNKMIRNRD
jgi:Cu2+-exporting ATPase